MIKLASQMFDGKKHIILKECGDSNILINVMEGIQIFNILLFYFYID